MEKEYKDLITYMGMHKLPRGFDEAYALYEPDDSKVLIDRDKYNELLAPYSLPADKKQYLDEALDAIESDEKVLTFSKFFVWDMCSMRNKYDIDNYTELVPSCLGKYNEAYGFLILLACVPVSEKEMIRRGIPKEYYEDIPHRMMRDQLGRYIETGKIDVLDMPWKMNFYTLTIFLIDRFLFIPYEHGDRFCMYRSRKTGKLIALADDGCLIDSEGQLIPEEEEDEGWKPEEEPADITGTGYVYARRKAKLPDTFRTYKKEDAKTVTGFYMNPCGFTENKVLTLSKDEYELALDQGDYLIALHIPGGEGYTPERMRNSMKLAMDFFGKYYSELGCKGFWSESWLYDKRIELIIGKGRNITNVSSQLYGYSGGWDGEMLYIHLYKKMSNKLEDYEVTSSLAKGAKKFMLEGNRFCSTGMIFLAEELENGTAYVTDEDEAAFGEMLKKNSISFEP